MRRDAGGRAARPPSRAVLGGCTSRNAGFTTVPWPTRPRRYPSASSWSYAATTVPRLTAEPLGEGAARGYGFARRDEAVPDRRSELVGELPGQRAEGLCDRSPGAAVTSPAVLIRNLSNGPLQGVSPACPVDHCGSSPYRCGWSRMWAWSDQWRSSWPGRSRAWRSVGRRARRPSGWASVGWVRNEPDGTVLCRAEGPAEAVAAFVDWCRRGTRWSSVERVDGHRCRAPRLRELRDLRVTPCIVRETREPVTPRTPRGADRP
jgi:hypothetical protein